MPLRKDDIHTHTLTTSPCGQCLGWAAWGGQRSSGSFSLRSIRGVALQQLETRSNGRSELRALRFRASKMGPIGADFKSELGAPISEGMQFRSDSPPRPLSERLAEWSPNSFPRLGVQRLVGQAATLRRIFAHNSSDRCWEHCRPRTTAHASRFGRSPGAARRRARMAAADAACRRSHRCPHRRVSRWGRCNSFSMLLQVQHTCECGPVRNGLISLRTTIRGRISKARL